MCCFGTTPEHESALHACLPYGCTNLGALFEHAALALDLEGGEDGAAQPQDALVLVAAERKPYRPNRSLCAALRSNVHGGRWDLLQELDFSRNILGDKGFQAVLSVIPLCPSLTTLSADRNELTEVSAKRIVRVLWSNTCLTRVSFAYNEFYPTAGDELLRLLRHNHKLIHFNLEGNPLTPYIITRVQRCLDRNSSLRENDIFDVLVERYSHLSQLDNIPRDSQKLLHSLWTLLTTAPAHPRSSSEAPSPRCDEATQQLLGTNSVDNTVPFGVTAPLFRTVMRDVDRGIAAKYRDPRLRQVFTEVCSHFERASSSLTVEGSGESDQGAPMGSNSAAIPAVESAANFSTALLDFYVLSFAKMVFVPLRVLAHAPNRWPDAARALQCLGAAHASWGISAPHYCAAGKFLFDALTANLGEAIMTPQLEAAWLMFYALIVRTVLAGTNAMM